jgi:cation transport regulator ChaB
MATVLDLYYQKLFDLMLSGTGSRISVPTDFHSQVKKIDTLFENDYTGIVSTVINFMVQAATVDINFITENGNKNELFTQWKKDINKNIAMDIPSGLRSLTEQYFRERWRSSFIVLKIRGAKNAQGYWMPTKMWFISGASVFAKGYDGDLTKTQYYLGKPKSNQANLITDSENEFTIIRKPYNQWFDTLPTPYLVKKGSLYHAIFKSQILQKQAEVINTALPYQMLIKLGCEEALRKGQRPTEADLKAVQEKFQTLKSDTDEHAFAKGLVGAVPFDVNFEELIPDYKKVLDKSITETCDKNLLTSLGMIELKGFSNNREEAILNPKVMVQEVEDGVADYVELLSDVVNIIEKKNAEEHRKTSKIDVQVAGGVVKAFLTEDMRKLIKDYSNTGLISIEDGFEALPSGFKFEVSKNRRMREQENGDEELFFPRVILNQDSNTIPDANPRPNATPQELPKKKKKEEAQYLQAPYEKIEDLPKQVKVLPEDGQKMWMDIFNNALKNGYDETVARKIAWSQTKKKYKKVGDSWKLKE